jgi:hypothetical protein
MYYPIMNFYFGSSAASVSQGTNEGGSRPGNSWLLSPAGIQQSGNAL